MVFWIPELIWTDDNIAHIARHQVEDYECEEARTNATAYRKGRDERYHFVGRTDGGRWLFVVIECDGEVVTARDATDRERRL